MKTGTLVAVAVGVGAPAICFVMASPYSSYRFLAPPTVTLAGVAGAVVGSAFKQASAGFVAGNVVMLLYLVYQQMPTDAKA